MTDKLAPTKWHYRPKGSGSCCPICQAPGTIRGEHRAVPRRKDSPRKYSILRAHGARLVERIIEPKKANRKRRKIDTSGRASITSRVFQRIISAGNLLAQGLTMDQVAKKLEVPLHALTHCQVRHPELWKRACDEAAVHAADIVRGMAGTSRVFVNSGKLTRLASRPADTVESSDAPGRVQGSGLLTFLEEVYLPDRLRITKGSANRLRSLIRLYEAFAGRPVTPGDLNEKDVCRYLRARLDVIGPVSVNTERGKLLAIWRTAFDHGYAEHPPRVGLIKKLPEEEIPPEAWTSEECNCLFSVVAMEPGKIGAIPAGQWWLSLLLTAYWTGCRIGALIRSTSKDFQRGGLLVRNQKNRRPQWYALPQSCCLAIGATNPASRNLLWPWHQCGRKLFHEMRRLVELAGLPSPRTHGQLFHRLRRTTISYCAAVDPAIAQRQAGHASYATTAKHYVDPRIVRGQTSADVLPEPIITTPCFDLAGLRQPQERDS